MAEALQKYCWVPWLGLGSLGPSGWECLLPAPEGRWCCRCSAQQFWVALSTQRGGKRRVYIRLTEGLSLVLVPGHLQLLQEML